MSKNRNNANEKMKQVEELKKSLVEYQDSRLRNERNGNEKGQAPPK